MPGHPSFHMTVEDVFVIRRRGTIVSGGIESGTLSVGDEIRITRPSSSKKTVVMAIEMLRQKKMVQLKQAHIGDDVGVLLGDVSKQDVQHGDLLVGSEPGSGRR